LEILIPLGSIKEEIKIVGTLKTKNITALFDTGAYRNYIRKQLYDGDTVDSIGFGTFEGEHNTLLADGSEAKGERIRFKELLIQGLSEKEPEFIVMENLLDDVIIGVQLMQRLSISPDPTSEKISIRK
jgi:predicted aspartyl protease